MHTNDARKISTIEVLVRPEDIVVFNGDHLVSIKFGCVDISFLNRRRAQSENRFLPGKEGDELLILTRPNKGCLLFTSASVSGNSRIDVTD